MSDEPQREAVPLFSHRIIQFHRMSVGAEWVFEQKVDPHDKILYALDGWIELTEYRFGTPLGRHRLEAGEMAFVPAHMAVDYRGSSPLDKMHLYVALEYLGMPIRSDAVDGCLVGTFGRRRLEHALADLQSGGPLAVPRLHNLVGYHVFSLLELASDQLARWAKRLERYTEIDRILESQPVFGLRVADLADVLGMGESTLSRNFHADTGQTLKTYLKDQVIYRSKVSLSGGRTIREIAADLGFEDEFYFSKFFKRETGFSPKQYRESLQRDLG